MLHVRMYLHRSNLYRTCIEMSLIFWSQLRIIIEYVHQMLVHQWGILRKPMPPNIPVKKITAMIMCLCKLHNYCIDRSDHSDPTFSSDLEPSVCDNFNINP